MDAAGHEDIIRIKHEFGPYELDAPIRILTPEDLDPEDPFYLTLEAFTPGSPPEITYGYPTEDMDNYHQAVIEIRNDYDNPENEPYCYDMRITISHLHVVGLENGVVNQTSALSLYDSVDDPNHKCNTGLFITDNYFESPNDFKASGVLVLGQRADQCNHKDTSIKWGAISGNEIVSTCEYDGEGGYSLDGIEAWHFSGFITDNIIAATQEGIHLSLACIDDSIYPSFLIEEVEDYHETIIEHNVFLCNRQTALHFAHGSEGRISNNLFLKSWQDEGNTYASGIHVGRGVADMCEKDPTECLECDLLISKAKIFNNVMDQNQGPGLLIHKTFTYTTYGGNIVRGTTCADMGDKNCAAIASNDAEVVPAGSWDHNLVWGNTGGNYSPAGVIPYGMEGPNDLNDPDTDQPDFQAWQNPEKTEYSYMLQWDEATDCYAASSQHSPAIDRGPDGMAFYDGVKPPGLEGDRNDIGAYGGPNNLWNESDPCFEITSIPDWAQGVCE